MIKEVKCKSLMNDSRIGDYCINPYVGCGHACEYCYAESITKRFSPRPEKWGQSIDAKINAPEVLEKELRTKGKGVVFISSLTDAYQPIEKKYQLTRKVLQLLLKRQFPVCIQTKSALVLRDMDLLKKFEKVEVGFTITSLDDNVRKDFEPGASTVEEKIEAIRELKENGIKVYVFFGPMLPYLSDRELEKFFKTMKELKVDYLLIDRFNLKPGLRSKMETLLGKKYPDLVEKWKDALQSKGYFEDLRTRITGLCKENNLECRFCY